MTFPNKKLLTIAIMLLTAANCWSLWMIYKQQNDPTASFRNPYPLIDPARSIVEQEHFFSTIEPLRKQLNEIVRKHDKEALIGLYFEYLNTGANVTINADTRFWPASLSKMPTAMAVLKKVENKEWKLSNELVLFADDKDERFGELYKAPVGSRFTIEQLLQEILINSDNTAHKILVRNLSSDDYLEIFEALGLEELFDQDYNISPKEYSRIFRALYNASYLKREHSQQLLTWLSTTRFNEFLDDGVPAEVPIAHKIGEETIEHTFLDSGIVYVPHRPYLITVMVDVHDGDRDKAASIIQELSQAAYAYVANN